MLPWGDPWHDGHMLEAWGYICRHTVTKTPYSWESTLSCERLCSMEKNVAMSLRVVVCNHDSHCLTSFLAQKLGAKRAQNRAKRAQYPAKRAQNQKVYRPMPWKPKFHWCLTKVMWTCPDGASTKKMLSHALLYLACALFLHQSICSHVCFFCIVHDFGGSEAWRMDMTESGLFLLFDVWSWSMHQVATCCKQTSRSVLPVFSAWA